jgi:hypothetical protein
MTSIGPQLPNTTLKVTLPTGVELISGDAKWRGEIPANGTVMVDLIIRVTTAGEWVVDVYAFSELSSSSGVGGGKTLYITSSTETAEVVEDIHRPTITVPQLQIAPTFTPTEEIP